VCREDCPTLDVDCCAEDGMCHAACGEALDPDCDPCLENGQCVTGCAVVDPDCCGDDLMCVPECGDTDPDCVACGANGECRADCPTLDPDCCAADARCEPACGDTDPDCVMTTPDPDPNPNPDPNPDPNPVPSRPVDGPGRQALSGKGRIGGGCTNAGMPSLAAAWVGVLGLVAISRRRRRGAEDTRRA
jgi:hypothetical protein